MKQVLPSLVLVLILGSPATAETPFPVGESPGAEPAVATLADTTAVFLYEAGNQVVFSIPGVVAESPVDPGGAAFQASPDVAVLPGAGFVAVWLAGVEGSMDPVARIFDPSGAAVTGVIDCGGQGHGVDVAVGARPGGGFVTTWAELWPPSIEDVFVRVHDPSGAPTGPVLQANGDGTIRNIHPQVAAAPDGSFTVAWGTNDIETSTCLSRRHDGGVWDVVRPLSAAGAFPDVAADSTGDLVVAWAATDGKKNVWCLPPGGSAYALGGSDAGFVAVARHPAGPAVVVWHEGGTVDNGRLRSRFLDAVGQPAGEVFTVADDTPWVGAPPGVSISPAGRVLFAWKDPGSGRIFARWWADPVVPVSRKSWGSLKSLWR